MSTIFDKVQAVSHLLAAGVSLTLGIVLISSGSWALDRILGVQSFMYYLFGYTAGSLNLSFRTNIVDTDILLHRAMSVLKTTSAIAIIGGILQMATSALIIIKEKSQRLLAIWTISTILTTILSIICLVLPLVYKLAVFLELHVLVTVSGLNAFIQTHLIVVVIIQITAMRKTEENDTESTTDGSNSSADSSRLPTPPPSPTPQAAPSPPPTPVVTPAKASTSTTATATPITSHGNTPMASTNV